VEIEDRTQHTPAAPAAEEPLPAAPRRRRIGVLALVALCVYALDVVSKIIVVATLAGRPEVHVIGSLLVLDYTRNPGAAFSIGGTGYTLVFSVIAAGVVVVILRLAKRLFSAPWAIALGLLLGGALGNLTDRIARAPGVGKGWVVDFIQVPHWPIFNAADSAICCGGALMVLLAFRGLHPDGTDERAAAAGNAPDGPRAQPEAVETTASTTEPAAGSAEPATGSAEPGAQAGSPADGER
jgi:signal peptidase II